MELVKDYQKPQHPSYHIPHHAVIREDSITTKVRVVFNASCRTPNGPSLNDALMIGPTVQENLRTLTLRSRIHPVLLNANLKQMYRQILMDQRSNNLQHIVWSSSPEAPLQTYELQTVTYGTASAPFLATRVLQQLADDEQTDLPEAVNVLRKDFYVDDLFSEANTIEEAITLRRQLESLLKRGGFELRQWASNEPAVVEDVPAENRALKSSVDLDSDQCIKRLRLHWEPATDVLRYKTQLPPTSTNESLTKRIALSHIARLFDPLGLGGPVRCVLFPSPTSLQIHIFTDASDHAYGACVYIRSTNSNGCVKVALLTSKSKVAPIKKQSIPRLELCGALVRAELYEKVMKSLQLTGDTFFWVDFNIRGEPSIQDPACYRKLLVGSRRWDTESNGSHL
ncbi:uncharacterized protein LOC135717594 [Ochlerotatus camptorhynchus]|uniref:uncharacterized protein LOC135717594 n=1 Tax=Ochlerotatus camptorhynchus TaxID=644619 RepID=UPI0031D0E098